MATRLRPRLEALEDRRVLSAGDLDLTFGGDGIVTTDFKKNFDLIHAVVVQADGKIIAGGFTELSTNLGSNSAIALTRYNVDGSLDTSFGGSKAAGKVVLNLSNQGDGIIDLMLQADGKILTVGGSSNKSVLVRFLNNGTLDKSFGTNGVRILDLSGSGSVQNMVIQPDGKIVVAGLTDRSGQTDFLLARFNATGALDPTFGTAGIVTTDIVSDGISLGDAAYQVAVQTDGTLVVAGKSISADNREQQLVLARYDANGTLDTTFGNDGLLLTGIRDIGEPSMVIDSNGRIIATTSDGSIFVARFLSNGSLDSTFGSNGVTSTDIIGTNHDGAGAVALDGNQQIVVAGYAGLFGGLTNPNKGFAVVRYQGSDSPLQAPGGKALANASVPTLTNEQVLPLLGDAVARWTAPGEDASNLGNVTVQIVDLANGYLGLASGSTIWLDAGYPRSGSAAGWGWFVDSTPDDDSEFALPGNQGEQDHMDLLTVLMHELGHLLGHDHDEDGVISETLAEGVRRIDTAHEDAVSVDHVFGQWNDPRTTGGWLSASLTDPFESTHLRAKKRR